MDTATLKNISQGLKHFRIMNGLTQDETSVIAGIHKNAYRRAEKGETEPRLEWITRLCTHYGIPVSRLLRAPDIPEVAFYTNRHASAREKALQQETVLQASCWAKEYLFLTEVLGIRPHPLPVFDLSTPQTAAQSVRKEFWEKGGFTPESFPGTLARYGIYVYIAPFPDPETFGFSFRLNSRCAVIAVNSGIGESSERQLWHAAHELGHIILGTDSVRHGKEDVAEREANAFATELILPETAFFRRWEDCAYLSFYERVIAVKRAFHATANAVLGRLSQHMSEDARKDLFCRFNALAKLRGTPNCRKSEPAPLNFIFEADRFRSLAMKACLQGEITMSKLAELYGCPLSAVRERLRRQKQSEEVIRV